MTTKRLRIGIDARYLSHGLVGGVHTYVRNLANALIESDAPIDYDLWIDDKCPYDAGALPVGSQTRILSWRSPLSSLRHDWRLGMLMRRAGADVVHFPANYGNMPPGVPTVLTLHDAINILPYLEIVRGHEKRPRALLTMSYLHLMTRWAVQQQPLVITVSQHARREILRHSDLKPERVQVVYSAADAIFRKLAWGERVAEQERLQLRERVLLADAIKNPQTTLQSYRRLPNDLRAKTSLIFFSRREPGADVTAAARNGECIVIRRPSTGYLVKLYNLADIFVFPSYIEGFGLPVLEAMSCGTPVVASGAGSLPEIVDGGGCIIPDPDDHAHFTKVLTDLLSNSERRAHLSELALERSAAFSWRHTAAETQAAYIRAIESSRKTRARASKHSTAPV